MRPPPACPVASNVPASTAAFAQFLTLPTVAERTREMK
jgi:hypothetical protein